MAKTCPHCGVVLPPVNDAFCGQCHERLDELPVAPRDEFVEAELVEPRPRPAADAGPQARKAGPFATFIAYVLFFVLMGGFVVMMVLSSSCSDDWFPDPPPPSNHPRVLPGKMEDGD